jgi:hypothetical protein
MLLFALAQAVVATAPAAAAPQQGVTSYGPEFFAALRPNTGLDMVLRLPGFTLDTGDSVRGYEGAAGNVLIDGQRPASKTEGIDAILQRLPAGRVARIDVIRGGAPGIDMQGKTVIANVVRKDGGGTRGLLAYAEQIAQDGRAFWALRAEGSGRVGARSWEAGLYAARLSDDGLGDGPRTRLDAAGKPLLLGDIHSQGVFSQVILTGAVESPLLGGQLRLNTRIYSNPYDLNETDFIRLPDSHLETEHDDDNIAQTEFGARYTHAYGGRINMELVGLRQDKHELIVADFRAPDDAEFFRLDNRTAETIARGVVKFQQTVRLSWEAGAEAALNSLDSQTRFSLNGAPVALPAANVTVEEKRGELFGKGVWRPISQITIEGSVREEGSRISSSGDVSLQKSLYFTKPRIALTWAPDADDQLRFRYERVVGQLDFTAFVASQNLSSGVLTAGNPNLVPEQAWVSEAAYERRFLGSGAFVITLRHSQITDVVDRAPLGDFDAPANIGEGTKDEEIVTLTLPLESIGLKGAQIRGVSTWRQSQVTDPTTGEKREITALHPSDWEAHFSQDLPNVRLNWGVDVFGGWRERYFRFNKIDTRKLGTYVVPFIEWKPRADLSLRFEIDNATRRGFKRTIQQYDGSRATSGLTSVEDRDPHFGQLYYVRLRKTFGG